MFKIAQVGASSVTIDRQRYGGAQIRLVTNLTGTRAEFADTRISRASRPVYTLAFTFADGTSKTCTTEDAMLHNEDIVVGTEEGKIGAMGFGTNPSSLATRDSFAPAYSPDGRWLGYSAPAPRAGSTSTCGAPTEPEAASPCPRRAATTWRWPSPSTAATPSTQRTARSTPGSSSST